MYTIEITTRQAMTEKQKNILIESVQDTDADAECQVGSTSCVVRGSKADPEILSCLLGIVVGSGSSAGIVKLQLSYEKPEDYV